MVPLFATALRRACEHEVLFDQLAPSDSLAKLAGQMTIVILGHRNAFLEIADQVLRLENGRLADEAGVV